MDSTEWYKVDGDHTYRTNYDLNDNSVIVDIGARTGAWSDLVKGQKFCFEPIVEYCNVLREKGYNTYRYAVSDTHGQGLLGEIDGEASLLQPQGNIQCELIPAESIFYIIGQETIDVMKINVEGAEYKILNNLIVNNVITKIKNIQVQFHVLEDSEHLYNEIAQQLSKTHKLTWRFPFIWENWELID